MFMNKRFGEYYSAVIGGHMLGLSRRASILNLYSNSPSTTGGVGQHKHLKALIVSALFICCWMVLAAVRPVHAQEVTASITGTVVDPGGAPVKGAKVTATDTERGTTLTTESNE